MSKWYKFCAREQKLLEYTSNGKPRNVHRKKYERKVKELIAVQNILNVAMVEYIQRRGQKFLKQINGKIITGLTRR
jgi:hypothetical protein